MIRTREELETARADAHRLVRRYALAAGAAGAVPLPGVDLAVDLLSLGRLLTAVNARFGVAHADLQGMDQGMRALLLGAVGGGDFIGKRLGPALVRRLAERLGARVLKRGAARLVPVVGLAAAAGVGYATVKAMGDAHVAACAAAVERLIAAREGAAP